MEETIAAVIAAVIDYLKTSSTEAWQKNVSANLDQIEKTLVDIINLLVSLRVEIKVDIKEEFVVFFETSIDGSRKNVTDIMASGKSLTAEHLANLNSAFNTPGFRSEVYQLADWSNYGFAGCSGVTSAVTTLLTISHLVKRPVLEIRNMCGQFVSDFYLPAIDPKLVGSFAWALAQANLAHDAAMAQINTLPRVALVNIHSRPAHPIDAPEIVTYVVAQLTGDMTTGFNVTTTSTEDDDAAKRPVFPGIDLDDDADHNAFYMRDTFNGYRNTVITQANHINLLTNYITSLNKIIVDLRSV